MSCDTYTNVMSPCADECVANAQSLGTRGDAAYDEAGKVELTEGQSEVEVFFLYEKCSEYVFEYLYVAGPDVEPDDIHAIPNVQTTKKFKVQLSGLPTTANSILYWHVSTPDTLVDNEPVPGIPQYAKIRPEQHGIAPLVEGQDYVIVEFAEEHPDNDWGFEQFSIEKAFTEADPEMFAWTATAHLTTGFTIQLSGAPTNGDTTLRWQIR